MNIRPGVKKKIYVFDGDTAEGLAERFSKEHSNYNCNYLIDLLWRNKEEISNFDSISYVETVNENRRRK